MQELWIGKALKLHRNRQKAKLVLFCADPNAHADDSILESTR